MPRASSSAILVTGEISSHAADAVVLATGGYGNVFYLSTNAKGCNVTATWRAYKKGAFFANPCYTQIHPTCIPVSGDHQSKLTLMSESLRNDGRVWVPKKKGDCGKPPGDIPEAERDYYLERKYPSFGNLAPRDISSRAAKEVCDEGRGVGPGGRGVYLDFADAIQRLGEDAVRERYGNLFDMYEKITGENGYRRRCAFIRRSITPWAALWVDYNLMSTLPGLFVHRRGQFFRSRRQPPRRQRADAGPGRRLFHSALHHRPLFRLGQTGQGRRRATGIQKAEEDVNALTTTLARPSTASAPSTGFHKELGKMLWEKCGMARNGKSLETKPQAHPGVARGILEKRQSDRRKTRN